MLNDEKVLELATRINQLRSAEADVARATADLEAVTKNRDNLKLIINELRAGTGEPTAASPNTSPAALANRIREGTPAELRP